MKTEMSIGAAAVFLMAVLMATTPNVVGRISAGSKVYNPMGMMGSGLGRTISRMLTAQADFAFHFGAPYPVGGIATTPAATMMQSLSKMSGPAARKIPPSIAESNAAISRTERLLELAFNLDNSYYPAYAIYYSFLTERPNKAHSNSPTSKPSPAVFQPLSAKTLRRAIDITHLALNSYRIEDPEQSVAAALATYNQYELLRPLVSPTDDKSLHDLTRKAADEMTLLLENANETVMQQEWSGAWDNRSEARREDYRQAYQLASKIKETLNGILEKQTLPKTEKSR